MNERQLKAYRSPATYADEVDMGDRTILIYKGSHWSTLLSVNK